MEGLSSEPFSMVLVPAYVLGKRSQAQEQPAVRRIGSTARLLAGAECQVERGGRKKPRLKPHFGTLRRSRCRWQRMRRVRVAGGGG